RRLPMIPADPADRPMRPHTTLSDTWFRLGGNGRHLDDHGPGLPTTCAHRCDAGATTATAQFVDQRNDHPRTRGGHRMSKTATAAEHVDDVLVDPEFLAGRDRH